MQFVLVLSAAIAAEEDLAERLTRLKAKVELGTAEAGERYELAKLLQRLGSTDPALAIALELTREAAFEPRAHYLVGQLRFQSDPSAASAAFEAARRSARQLGRAGEDFAAQAGAALALAKAEAARPARTRAAAEWITLGLWFVAGAWLLAILIAWGCTKSRAGASRST